MVIYDHWFHAVFITTIIMQSKKNIVEIKKIEKYSQTNVYVEIVCVYVCVCMCVCLCVSVYGLYLHIIVCSRICDRCMFVYDIHASRGRLEFFSKV